MNLIDPFWGSALQVALHPGRMDDENNTRMTRYLLDETSADVGIRGGKLGYPISLALMHESLDIARVILHKGGDVESVDDFGRWPIHFASLKTLDHVHLLIDVQADLTVRNKLGQKLTAHRGGNWAY